MTKTENRCLAVMLIFIVCWAVLFSGCVKVKSNARDLDPRYIECPAKLMTDADELWICAYVTEADEGEETLVFGFIAGPCCRILDCQTVRCGDMAYANLEVDDESLSGTLQADDVSIEFICV